MRAERREQSNRAEGGGMDRGDPDTGNTANRESQEGTDKTGRRGWNSKTGC